MLRTALFAVGALVLSGSALAQSDASSRMEAYTGPIRDAGTYHLGSKTWTRSHQSANRATAEVLYVNNCVNAGVVYWIPDHGQTGESNTFDGRIPSDGAPTPFHPGKADGATINGIELVYVTREASRLRYNLAFYNQRGPLCSLSHVASLAGVINAADFPGSPVSGSTVLWQVTLDWKGTAAEFHLAGDGDWTWSNVPDDDNFGHEHHMSRQDGTVTVEGTSWTLVGDPIGKFGDPCPFGGDTYYHPGAPTADGSTGLGSRLTWISQDGFMSGVSTGCWFFGSYYDPGWMTPYAAVWAVIYGEHVVIDWNTKAFCHGDGSEANCPCANNNNDNTLIPAGCANSSFASGAQATFDLSGYPSAVRIRVVNMKPGMPAVIQRGSAKFAPIPILDGLLCIGGNTARSDVFFANAAGAATSPILPQGPAGVQWNYQAWYRDNFLCAGSLFSNAIGVLW